MGTKRLTCLLIALTGLSLVSASCDLEKSRTCMATQQQQIMNQKRAEMNQTLKAGLERLGLGNMDKESMMEAMRGAERMMAGMLAPYNITMPFKMDEVVVMVETMMRYSTAMNSGAGTTMDLSMMGNMVGQVMRQYNMSMPDWMMGNKDMMSMLGSKNMSRGDGMDKEMDWGMMAKMVHGMVGKMIDMMAMPTGEKNMGDMEMARKMKNASSIDWSMMGKMMNGSNMDLDMVKMVFGMMDKMMNDSKDMDWEMVRMVQGFMVKMMSGSPDMGWDIAKMVHSMAGKIMEMVIMPMGDKDMGDMAGKMMNGTSPSWSMMGQMMQGMFSKVMEMLMPMGNKTMTKDMAMAGKMMNGSSEMDWTMMTKLVQGIMGKMMEMMGGKNMTKNEMDMVKKMINGSDMDWTMMEAMYKKISMMFAQYNMTLVDVDWSTLAKLPGLITDISTHMAQMNGTEMDWAMMLKKLPMMMAKHNITIPGVDFEQLAKLPELFTFLASMSSNDTMANMTFDPMMMMSIFQQVLKGMKLPMILQAANVTVPDWALPFISGDFNMTAMASMKAKDMWSMHGLQIKQQLGMMNISIDMLEPFIPGVLQIIDMEVNITSATDVWNLFAPQVNHMMAYMNMSAISSMIPMVVSVIDGKMNMSDAMMMIMSAHQSTNMSTMMMLQSFHGPMSGLMESWLNITLPALPNVTEMQTAIQTMGYKNFFMSQYNQLQAMQRENMASMNNTRMMTEMIANMTGGLDVSDPKWLDTYLSMAITEASSQIKEMYANTTSMIQFLRSQLMAMNETLSQDSEVAFLYQLMEKHNLTEKMMFNWTQWFMSVNVSETLSAASHAMLKTHSYQQMWFNMMIDNYTQVFIGQLNDSINYLETNKNSASFFQSLNISEKIGKDADKYLEFLKSMQSSGVYNNLTTYLGITKPNNLAVLIADLENLKNSPGSFIAATNETDRLRELITMLQMRNVSELCPPPNASDYESIVMYVVYPMAIVDKLIMELHTQYGPFVMDVMALNMTADNLTTLFQRVATHYHINTELPMLRQWWGYGTVILTNVITSYVDISTLIAPENIIIYGNLTLADLMAMDLGMTVEMMVKQWSTVIDANTLMSQEGFMNMTHMVINIIQESAKNNSALQSGWTMLMSNGQVHNISSALLDVFFTGWFQSSNPFHMYANETQMLLQYLDVLLELNQTKAVLMHEMQLFNATFVARFHNVSAWAMMFGMDAPQLPMWLSMINENFTMMFQKTFGGMNATSFATMISQMSGNMTSMSWWSNPMSWWTSMTSMHMNMTSDSWMTGDWMSWWSMKGNMSDSWMNGWSMKGNMSDSWMDWWSMKGNMSDSWMDWWSKGSMSEKMMGMWSKGNMSDMWMDMWSKGNMSDGWMDWWSKMYGSDKGDMWKKWEMFQSSNMSYWEMMAKMYNMTWEKKNKTDFDYDLMMRIMKNDVLPPFLQAFLLGSWEPVNMKQVADNMLNMMDSGIPEHALRYSMNEISSMDMSYFLMAADMMAKMEEMKDDAMWMEMMKWGNMSMMNKDMNMTDMWGWLYKMTMDKNMTDKMDGWKKMLEQRKEKLMEYWEKMDRSKSWDSKFFDIVGILRGNESMSMGMDFNMTDIMGIASWMKEMKNSTTFDEWMAMIEKTNITDYFPKCADEKDDKDWRMGMMMWNKMPMMPDMDMMMSKMTLANFYTSAYIGAYTVSSMMGWMEMKDQWMGKMKNATEDRMDKMNETMRMMHMKMKSNESWSDMFDMDKGMMLIEQFAMLPEKFGMQTAALKSMTSMMMMMNAKKEEDPLSKNIKRAVFFSHVAKMMAMVMMNNDTVDGPSNIPNSFKEIVQINKMLEYAKPKMDSEKFDFNSFARHVIFNAAWESHMADVMKYVNASVLGTMKDMGDQKVDEWNKMVVLMSAMSKSYAMDYSEYLGNYSMMLGDHRSTLYPILAHKMYIKMSVMMENQTEMSHDQIGAFLFVMSFMKDKEDAWGIQKQSMKMMTLYNFAQDTQTQAELFPSLANVLNTTFSMLKMNVGNMSWSWGMEKSMNRTMNMTKALHRRNETERKEEVGECTMQAVAMMMGRFTEKVKMMAQYGGKWSKDISDYTMTRMDNTTKYIGEKVKDMTKTGYEIREKANNYSDWAMDKTKEWNKSMMDMSLWLKNMSGVCDFKNDPECKNGSIMDIGDKMNGMVEMVKSMGVCGVMDYAMPMERPTSSDSLANIVGFTLGYSAVAEAVLYGANFTTMETDMCGSGVQNFESALIASMMKLINTKRLLGESKTSRNLMEMKAVEEYVKNTTGVMLPKRIEDKKTSDDSLSSLLIGIGQLNLQNQKLDLGSIGALDIASNTVTPPRQCNVGNVLSRGHMYINGAMKWRNDFMEPMMTGMLTNYTMMIKYKLHELAAMAKLDAGSQKNFTQRITSLDFSVFKEIMMEAKANLTANVAETMNENMVNLTEAFGADFDMMSFLSVVNVLDKMNFSEHMDRKPLVPSADMNKLAMLLMKQKHFNATQTMNRIFYKFTKEAEKYSFNVTEILLNMTAEYRTFDIETTWVKPVQEKITSVGGMIMWLYKNSSACLNHRLTEDKLHFDQLYSNISKEVNGMIKSTFDVSGDFANHMKTFTENNLTFSTSQLGKILTAAGTVHKSDRDSQMMTKMMNSKSIYGAMFSAMYEKGESLVTMMMGGQDQVEEMMKTGVKYITTTNKMLDGGLPAALGYLSEARAQMGAEAVKKMMTTTCMYANGLQAASQCVQGSTDTCNATVQQYLQQKMEPVKQAQSGSVVASLCSTECKAVEDLSDCVAIETKGQQTKDGFINTKDPFSRQRRALGEKTGIDAGQTPTTGSDNMCTTFTQINVCVKTKIAGCTVLEQSYTTTMQPFLQEIVPYCGSAVVDGPTPTPGVMEQTTKDNGVLIDNGLGNNGASGIAGEYTFFLLAAALSLLYLR